MPDSKFEPFTLAKKGDLITFNVHSTIMPEFNGLRNGIIVSKLGDDDCLEFHVVDYSGFDWCVKQLGENQFEAGRGPIQ